MLRVLLIDDNAQDRLLVLRELKRMFPHLQAQEVRDERELNDALEAGQFDLAVTDYQLNWTTGLAILHALKARYPDRPVIMFTGTGSEEVAVEAMRAGLDDYVLKSPRHYIRLVTAVRTALDHAEAWRQAEQERARLLAREQAARAEAERLYREAREADRRKDEFLAMLAHELRNPLSPIVNALHLLRQPNLQAADMERLRAILHRQVRHMARLVDDLLDVSRITRGKIQLRRERTDLADVVRAAAEDHRNLVESAGLRLDVEVPQRSVWVDGDPVRLAQVVGNLLNNATKFTDAGGQVAVRLAEDRSRRRAIVEVADTGVGIEPSLMPSLFEVFIQADRSLDRSRGGLGLGLALVKGLVELHEGQVTAASDGPAKGARFSFGVPLAAAPAAAEAAPPPAGDERPARILIIEDSRDAAEALRLLLDLSGHQVAVAYTGAAGVEEAKRFRPTVVLCDLGLPGGMNGYDVARALRQDPATAGLRLIALSGYGQPEDRRRGREAGFDLHLTKPVAPEELERVLADGE